MSKDWSLSPDRFRHGVGESIRVLALPWHIQVNPGSKQPIQHHPMGSCQEAGWSKSETRQCQSTAFKEKVRFAHPVDKMPATPLPFGPLTLSRSTVAAVSLFSLELRRRPQTSWQREAVDEGLLVVAVKPPLQHSQETIWSFHQYKYRQVPGENRGIHFLHKKSPCHCILWVHTMSKKMWPPIPWYGCHVSSIRSPFFASYCCCYLFDFIDSTSAAHLFHAYVISPLDKILLLRVGPFWSLSPASLTLSSHHFAENLNFSKIPHLHCSVALFKCFSILSVSQLHFPLLCLSPA